MPELPDLEVQCKNLTKLCQGETVESFTAKRPKRVHPSADAIEKAMKGEKLVSFDRAGKQMRIKFSNGQALGVHLMLNGELHVCAKGEEAKNVTAELAFKSGKFLAFTDRQAWITIEWNPSDSKTPDAFDKEFKLPYFESKVRAKGKTPIKMLLVDQEVVQGIGNAYADEILWHARVDPESLCKDLPVTTIEKIFKEICRTLEQAVKEISKNHPDLSFGEPRDHLAVHNNGKDTSPTGRKILTKDIKGKKTYYTEEQKKY